MVIKTEDDIREANELEEVVENEINRLWQSGGKLEDAVKAAARLRRTLEERKYVIKSGG